MLTRAPFLVLIICTTLQTVMMHQEPKRLGCYKDYHNNRDLPKVENLLEKMTVSYCLIFCRSLGFNYTGLQAGDTCACGNSFGRHGKVGDNECQSSCSGDAKQTCGGVFRNEIYITGQYHIARIGCFKGVEGDKEEIHSLYAGKETTVPFCMKHCRFMRSNYTSVMSSTCFCAHKSSSIVIQKDVNCQIPCEADKLTTCGGSAPFMEIFQTFYGGTFPSGRRPRPRPRQEDEQDHTETDSTSDITDDTIANKQEQQSTPVGSSSRRSASWLRDEKNALRGVDQWHLRRPAASRRTAENAPKIASKTAIIPAPLLVPLLVPMLVPLLVQRLVC